MRVTRATLVTLVAAWMLAACATPRVSDSPVIRSEEPALDAAPSRTLMMVVRYEVTDLAPKIPGSSNPSITKRLFNAALALIDGSATARPYLAEELPGLNTEGWKVFPDGRMETTYRLRPGLAWHDGHSLTASDFAFAFRVYTAGLGVFQPAPQDQMEAVLAPDDRTIVVRWRSPHPNAAALVEGDLEPLPRHILEPPLLAYEQDDSNRDAFLDLPFWTLEYVGAGPYRLERWEPGSHLEGASFDRHALGRPKIDRVVARIVADENTVLTGVLADAFHYTALLTLRFEHAMVLRPEWAAMNKGQVLMRQGGPVTLLVQMRPEYAAEPALLDRRVRGALAHSIDRKALSDGLFEGHGFVSEILVPEGAPHYADVERVWAKHPYDPRRSEQLMTEAGFAKDREGSFVSASGGRFQPDYRVTGGPEFERSQAINADTWKRAGFDVQASVLPAARARDRETRHTFPAIASRGGLSAWERTWTTLEIGTAANRWSGENRGGWSNPSYDRLWETFRTTLDRSERSRQVARMMTMISEEQPVFMLYFSVQVMTHGAALRGPEAGLSGAGALALETLPHWNIHEWELR